MLITNICKEPELSIEFVNTTAGNNKKVLFLWEEGLYNTPIHKNIIYLNENVQYFSQINKNISFFEDGVVFKIIDISNHELIWSHEIKNLNFIKGKKILYIAQNNHTGYGFAARNCIHQLMENGYDVQWESNVFGREQNLYTPSNKYEVAVNECRFKKVDYDCVLIHHIPVGYADIFKKLNIDNSKPIYGSTVWETTKLYPSWVNTLNTEVREIIVPSNFNKEIFENSGVKNKIHLWRYDIFPIEKKKIDFKIISKFHIYENGKYTNNQSQIENILKENTVYYNISQYSARKNINQSLITFCKKFNENDKVCFLIKTFLESFNESEKEILKYKFKNILSEFNFHPKIIFCFEELNTEELDNIHRIGDVYFTLNRGEGFGLCSYTAKKFGNKVICGSFGSEKEFIDYNDILIPYVLKKPHGMVNFHNWYDSKDQLWADFNDDDIIQRLKYYPKKNIK